VKPLRKLILLALAACTATAWAGSREPHIGYLFPAGGQQGTTFEVTVGGQFLRGANALYISGDGVRASIIKHYRPSRNLQKEQRENLVRQLWELREKRLAELPEKDRARIGAFPGVRPPRKNTSKPKAPPKKEAPKKPPAKGDAAKEGGPKKDLSKLPEHPLLRNLEKKSLRELLAVANEFFNYKAFQKKQLNSQLAEMVIVEVTIDPDATPGDRELRLGTPFGLTNPMCFQVGTLPEAREQEPNDPGASNPLPEPPPLDLPVLLNGQIMPGDVDRVRFRAKQGQQLVIETYARHLVPFLADAVPGWFQAVVALYDARGKEVAYADDWRFDPDPVIFCKVPATGEYVLEVRDAIYRGREDFVYRIAIGELPFITRAFPLGGTAGAKTVVAIDGWNLPKKRLPLDTRPGTDPIRHAVLRRGRRPSNEVTYAVDTLPDCTETEPNDDAKTAQRIELPRIVNGRIAAPGDVDIFAFEGRAGDTIVAEVQARRLRSPLDSLLRLTDAAGRVLAWNDDHMVKEGHLHPDMGFLTHHADSYLTARLPADGLYHVRVADAQRHGGDAYGYRLRVSPPQPDFVLLATPSSLTVPGGCAALLTVHALRKDGFDGDIELVLADAPAGFALSGGWIPRGRHRARMTLSAPPKPLARPVVLRLEGRTQAGGKTVTRPVVPADNVMQAFLWRHLAPSRQLMVAVTKPRWNAFPARLVGRGPIKIPAGGTAQVKLKSSKRRRGQIALSPVEPPEGISVSDVKTVADGLTFQLKADGKAAKAGLADNLIIEASAEYDVRVKGKPTGKKRRTSLGTLPAIPFVVVKP